MRYVPQARNEKRLHAFTNEVTESLCKSNRVIDQLTAHDALAAAKPWTHDLIRLCAEARRIQKAMIRDNLL